MTKDSGTYERTVPEDNPADTRPDLKATTVIVDVRFRDGSQFIGFKEYVDREAWTAADRDGREEIIAGVTRKLLDAMDSPERDQ